MREPPECILASCSPRRRQIPRDLGFQFEICAVDIDEAVQLYELPVRYVIRLVREKALTDAEVFDQSTHRKAHEPSILAVDTAVALGDRIFGKPLNRSDAFRIWTALSDWIHRVYSGVALLVGNNLQAKCYVKEVALGPVDEG